MPQLTVKGAVIEIEQEVLDALKRFKAEQGRCWRSRLIELWALGQDAHQPHLRRARNLIGPRNLMLLEID